MPTFKFNKLIRDKIYKNMLKCGADVSISDNTEKNYMISCLKNKLLEEAYEVSEEKNHDKIKEELADCLEVIISFASVLDVNFSDIDDIRKIKRQQKGSFQKNIMVNHVTVSEECTDSEYYKFFISYCRAQPNKYPEISISEHNDTIKDRNI